MAGFNYLHGAFIHIYFNAGPLKGRISGQVYRIAAAVDLCAILFSL